MFALFTVALAVQILYWLLLSYGFSRVSAARPGAESSLPPVSTVVAARNEAGRIAPLLDALAAQTHPDFEVVLADDASEDATPGLIAARADEDPRFRLIRVEDPRPPRKKHALTAGVAAARHDRLAFTDADCTPPPRWLETLAAHAAEAPGAVLIGYGPFTRRPGALNSFVRYETLVTAFFTAAAVGLGRPYMAVGRNFSYPRSLFDRLGGFAHSMQSLSGDDDLLVQEAHRHGTPVRYVLDPAAFVPSEAASSWRQWVRQKLRHTSAGRYYSRSAQAHLAAFHLSNLLVWLAPLALGWTGAGLLAARFLVQRAVLARAASAFEETDLMVTQPLLDLGYLFYNALLAPAGALLRPKRW